ncbi:MAG: peroxiredoxin [Phototrophicaceae bacterium]
MPAIGTPAPDFELMNQDGQPVKLSALRGKKVILFAYPRAATSGCTTQACGFRDAATSLKVHNAIVLGISDDPVDKLKDWHTAENFGYDLLSDEPHSILEAWGAWGEKTMYGKTYLGTVRSHWVIDENGIILDEQISISPKKSVEQALIAIEPKG